MRPDASRFTRVCAYDRAGNGDSDSRPGLGPNDPVPASRVIDELHALLHNGAIPGPPIVVEAIRQVVLALRSGGTLPACASSPIVAAGGECLTP